MDLRRFFRGPTAAEPDPVPRPAAAGPDTADTQTVRRIVARLEALPADQARFIACAAYVIARAANADLSITDPETVYMEDILQRYAGLDEAQSVLVTEMAKLQARAVGGTEDFLVTREFRAVSTPEQRMQVLRACFAVTAVDDSISAAESAVINEIANELEIEAEDLAALRGEFTEKFAAIQTARRTTGAPGDAPAG